MQIEIAKSDLNNAMEVVSGSLASSGSGAEMYAHLVFRVLDTDTSPRVEVLTSNGRVFSSCPLICRVKVDPNQPTAFTIEAKRLKTWMQHVPDAALAFSLEGGDVVARSPLGHQTFQSLDPKTFPYWDKLLDEAKVTAKLEARRLAAALGYARLFTSTQESTHPQLCVCEVPAASPTQVGGIIHATDNKAVTLVKVTGLEASTLRIFTKSVGGFLTFLATAGQEMVEILEHNRCHLIRRADGAVFGESRFHAAFPAVSLSMDDQAPDIWSFQKAEIEQAIGFLSSGAAWEDSRLTFTLKDDGKLGLSMSALSGKPIDFPLTSATILATSDTPIPPFALNHFILAKVLHWWKEDVVDMHIHTQGRMGYVRFSTKVDGDHFVTILACMA
jgi:hypothetical protein